MRRTIAWCLAVPLILGGTEAAHSLAYRLAYPEAEIRLRMLSATGHGYEAYLPLAAGVVAAIAFVALFATAVDAARRRPVRSVPAWMFALLPPVAFTVQEYTERWLHGVNGVGWMIHQPTFRYGLLLQIPFAFLAFLAARLLGRVAAAAGRLIAKPVTIVTRDRRPLSLPILEIDLPRPRLDALGWSLRGPPSYGLSS